VVTLITTVLGIISPFLYYLIRSWADAYFKKNQDILDQEKLQATITDFKDHCMRAVKQVDMEFVLPLKKEAKWDDAGAEEARQKAIALVHTNYNVEQLVNLAMVFKTDAVGLDSLIVDTVEAQIVINKKADTLSIDLDIPDDVDFSNLK